MHITILGSGGVLPTPIPLCTCRICQSARKDKTQARRGPSFFLHDISAMIDTPEDIWTSLQACSIRRVNRIFYSHWHPDHTLGFRVVEALRPLEFAKRRLKPIDVFLPEYEMENMRRVIPALWYFESKKYIRIVRLKKQGEKIRGFMIRPLRLSQTTFSAFELQHKQKRVLLCPDHSKHFPTSMVAPEPDLLIANLGYLETRLKGGNDLPKRHRIRSLTSFQDNLALIDALKPKRTVLTHIEERWNRTPGEFKEIAKSHHASNLFFATDGLDLKI